MLYKVLKYLTKLALLAHYRKIYLDKDYDLPKDRPIILAANHPNAFTEPLLLACFLKRELYFITRADVFKPSLQWFFDQTHQIPIYRFEDGYSGIKKNLNTFDNCFEILSKNKMLLIFSEGRTRIGKKVHSVVKGTARIAMGLMEKYPEKKPLIIPVGFSYSKPTSWDGVVHIRFAPPIDVSEFAQNDDNPRKSILSLSKKIEEELRKVAIDLNDLNDGELEEKLASIMRLSKDKSSSVLKRNTGIFAKEKSIEKLFNQKRVTAPNKDEPDLMPAAHRFFGWTKLLFLILMFLPAIAGLLLFLPAGILANYIKNYKVKSLQFKSGVLLVSGFLASLLLSLLWALGLGMTKGLFVGIFGLVAVPLLILIGIKWMSYLMEFRRFLQWHAKPAKEKRAILSTIKSLMPEYEI